MRVDSACTHWIGAIVALETGLDSAHRFGLLTMATLAQPEMRSARFVHTPAARLRGLLHLSRRATGGPR